MTVRNLKDHKESDLESMIGIENSFQRQEYRRQPLDQEEYCEDLKFQIKLNEFIRTLQGDSYRLVDSSKESFQV